MSELLSNQIYVFLIYCLCGVILGIFFDIFRILRKSFNTSDIVTYLEDICFWLISGMFLIYIIFKFNNGELRNYIFIGLAIGIIIYLLVFSKVFIKINVFIIMFIKNIIKKIFKMLIYPIANIFKRISINLLKITKLLLRKFKTNITKKHK